MGQAKSSAHFKDKRIADRTSARMVQNVLLVWLDANINRKKRDRRNIVSELRHAVNTIHTFTNDEDCIEFLKHIVDEKICVIISGSLGQQIVPHVHSLSQVDSIFIFCDNQKHHNEWVKDWSKIKGIFTEIGSVCDALKQAARQCEQNAISISIMSGGDDLAKQNLNQLDPSFMYTQIMKEIIFTINFEQQHFNEFIQHCREALINNKNELKNVNQFARKYRQYTPIWWYTSECFLYPMLNRALRMMDVDLIIKLGFFIGDLHRHIEQLHREQFNDNDSSQHFTVYRGQGMEKKAFQKMLANKGGLISFNSFLSTSKVRSVSLGFAQRVPMNDQMVSILFLMNIDPTQSSTPFASVADVGHFGKEEDEVLFSMHTVFRIGEIAPMSGNHHLIQVQLSLVNDKENDLRQLINYIRKETFPSSTGWYRMGSVLRKMGHPAKAQQVYEILLRQATEENAKASIYHQLGLMKAEQAEYARAIGCYQKSIELQEKQISRNDLRLASTYNNIASAYSSIGDYRKALLFHQKDVRISRKILPSTHPDLASSYVNIGLVCYNMEKYREALLSYEKALAIQQQSLPPNHPDLAASCNNIGLVYFRAGDYPKALLSHAKALAIRQQSLPSTHPSLAMTYNNIGLVYESMANYSKAYSCFEHAVDIAERSLPSNHPHLENDRQNLARVKKNL